MGQVREYSGIDAFRLIAAFFIVGLHVHYGDLNNGVILLLHRAGRFAVPFFFMVSGFFWKIDTPGRLRQLIIKLLAIIAIANLIYYTYYSISTGSLTSLLQKEMLITGIAGHLWFLNALLIGSVFMYYIGFRISKGLMAFVALLLYVVYCLLITYKGVAFNAFNNALLRSLLAIPFLFAGHVARTIELRLRSLNWVLISSLVIGGFILSCVEAFFMYRRGLAISPYAVEYNFSLLIFSAAMLLAAIKINAPRKLAALGRDHALFIYLYHPLLIAFYGLLVSEILPGHLQHYAYWGSLLMVFAMTFVLSLGFARFSPQVFRLLNGRLDLSRASEKKQ